MPWGSLSSLNQIQILVTVRGAAESNAALDSVTVSTERLGTATKATSAEMDAATANSWLHNQALFTARRYAFYATLAITALAYSVGKLGLSYLSTVQTAKVALRGMFGPGAAGTAQMDDTINRLYRLSTFSPFLFKDTLTAFRTMAPAMKAAGIPVAVTLQTMHASMDALSESGKTSFGQLTRVSTQLQHLANIGRPTGQVMLALARDGLPVYPALRKELGLTGDSLSAMSTSGLTALQTITALNKYIETSPIYKGQAFAQATKTLQGNWMMFKDILAQAAGTAEGGLFGGLTQKMTEVNKILRGDMAKGPVSITNIAEALDKAFTPNTHIILNFFILFASTLKTIVFEMQLLLGIVDLLLRPIDYLASLFGQNWIAMRLLGGVLGTLITMWLVYKTRLMVAALWLDASRVYTWGLTAAQTVLGIVTWLWTTAMDAANFALVWMQVNLTGETILTWLSTAASYAFITALWLWNAAVWAVNAAMTALDAVLLADPIVLLVVAVIALVAGLVILYFKWKAFHDLVNATARFLWNNPWAAVFIPLIGQLILMAKLMVEIYNHAAAIAGFVMHPIRGIQHAVGHGAAGTAVGIGMDILNFVQNPIGSIAGWAGLQSGGFVTSSGIAMVGEHGPELLHLPAASTVQPFNKSMLTGQGTLQIMVYPQDIYLDSKKIATVLATAVTSQEARR